MLAEAHIPPRAHPLPADAIASLLTAQAAPAKTVSGGPVKYAICGHKIAWMAYQIAPEGEPQVIANDEMAEALDRVLSVSCLSLTDADALLVHLLWWLVQEAEFAADYCDAYSAATARANELALLLGRGQTFDKVGVVTTTSSPSSDPIFALLHRLDALTAASVGSPLNGAERGSADARARDDEIDQMADQERFIVFEILRQPPRTRAGLDALLQFASERYQDFHLSAGVPDVFSVIAEAARKLALNEAAPAGADTPTRAFTQNPRS